MVIDRIRLSVDQMKKMEEVINRLSLVIAEFSFSYRAHEESDTDSTDSVNFVIYDSLRPDSPYGGNDG